MGAVQDAAWISLSLVRGVGRTLLVCFAWCCRTVIFSATAQGPTDPLPCSRWLVSTGHRPGKAGISLSKLRDWHRGKVDEASASDVHLSCLAAAALCHLGVCLRSDDGDFGRVLRPRRGGCRAELPSTGPRACVRLPNR